MIDCDINWLMFMLGRSWHSPLISQHTCLSQTQTNHNFPFSITMKTNSRLWVIIVVSLSIKSISFFTKDGRKKAFEFWKVGEVWECLNTTLFVVIWMLKLIFAKNYILPCLFVQSLWSSIIPKFGVVIYLILLFIEEWISKILWNWNVNIGATASNHKDSGLVIISEILR